MRATDLNTALSRIKEKIPISQVIGKDIVLKKKGREFSGNCPFHNEKTASFFVNDDKGTFYCFGCGASGDVVEYLIKKRGISFQQAIENLASIAGIKLPEAEVFTAKDNTEQKVLQKAIEFYKKCLNENETAKNYCNNRGLNKETIESFGLGYSPLNGSELFKYLKSCGFSENDLISSGLFIKRDSGITNRFKSRIMFPVLDQKGWPIAFGGRSLQKDALPKYLNSSESEIFQKKEVLYGYNLASKNASEKDQIIVVEGYMDVVMMHQYGFKTTVASMGTAFSSDQLMKVWKYSKQPIICFDGDKAGYNAMVKLAQMAIKYISHERMLKFCLIPNDLDPDSFLKSNNFGAMQKLIDEAFYLIDFMWYHFEKIFDEISVKTPEHIAKWKKDVLNFTEEIADSDIKNLYKSELKDRIYSHIRKSKKQNSKTSHSKYQIFAIDKRDKILLREAVLLYTMIVRPSVIPAVIEKLSLVDFAEKKFETLRNSILECYDIKDEKANLDRSVIADLESLAGNYCQFDGVTHEEVLSFWNDIYDINFDRKAQRNDILLAKEECTNECNSDSWERLKALKIYDILNKKK